MRFQLLFPLPTPLHKPCNGDSRYFRRFAVIWLLVSIFASCAYAEPAAPQIEFDLSARFALRVDSGAQTGSYAGRLYWEHRHDSEHLLFSSPLGQGLAEIYSTPQGASLHLSNGETRFADDPATLIKESLGYALPVHKLVTWLSLTPASATHVVDDSYVRQDRWGRPSVLLSEGWRIEYSYPDTELTSQANKITILREQEMELRLRIEDWQILPSKTSTLPSPSH